ncbi:Protein of unknown function [Gryllus bimaculatus]|nr:Protein of unknown function [Gryllus bimaculatus]
MWAGQSSAREETEECLLPVVARTVSAVIIYEIIKKTVLFINMGMWAVKQHVLADEIITRVFFLQLYPSAVEILKQFTEDDNLLNLKRASEI